MLNTVMLDIARTGLEIPGLEGPAARLLARTVAKKYPGIDNPPDILAKAAKDAKTDQARKAIGDVWAEHVTRIFESNPHSYFSSKMMQKATAALEIPDLRPHAAAVVTGFLEKSIQKSNWPGYRTFYTIMDVAKALEHEKPGSERTKSLAPRLSALWTSAINDANSLPSKMLSLIEGAHSPILGKASFGLIMKYGPGVQKHWPDLAQTAYETALTVKGLTPPDYEKVIPLWTSAVLAQGKAGIDAAEKSRAAGTLNDWLVDALDKVVETRKDIQTALPRQPPKFIYHLHH